MTVRELIEMLQAYPNQDMKIILTDSENGEEDPSYLEEQRHYIGCKHYPKHDERGFPIRSTGTYYHDSSCRLVTYCVALRS